MDKEQYYTTGELAHLFSIPKQTMLYYEKTGLLRPAFIAENGYRYYAYSQYLTLEMILFLRRLDIPVPEIHTFLNTRSPQNVLQMVRQRMAQCREAIKTNAALLERLTRYEKRLSQNSCLLLDRCQLRTLPALSFFLSPIPPQIRGGTPAIELRAGHVNQVFAHTPFKDRPTWWIVRGRDFFAGRYAHASAILTECSPYDPSPQPNFIREAGLYVLIHVKGSYYRKAERIRALISDFLKRNELTPCSDVYVCPTIDYWTARSPDEYVNTISIRVNDSNTPPRMIYLLLSLIESPIKKQFPKRKLLFYWALTSYWL